MPNDFAKALQENPEAYSVFEQLSASRKQEIVRYLARLKTKETLDTNIIKAISFLLGKEKFAGRENPYK